MNQQICIGIYYSIVINNLYSPENTGALDSLLQFKHQWPKSINLYSYLLLYCNYESVLSNKTGTLDSLISV